jgi:outer membrane protein assembly factor BamB
MAPGACFSADEISDRPSESRSGFDWPFIRGPNYDGCSRETGLVDSFPAEGPPVLWTRPLGVGYSGFTTTGDRLFTQYQTLGGQYVVCLNAATGETLWEHRYGLPYEPAGLYPGPRATPTIDSDRVYFAAPDGLVGCLDISTGRRLWSLNVYDEFGVAPVEFGYSCSPVVVAGKVLLPVGKPNASVVALEAATGRVVWRAGNDAISHVPVLSVRLRGRSLALGYLRNVISAFDIDSGAPVFRIPRSGGYDEHAAWPLYREPYLWVTGPFRGGCELMELTAESPGYRTVWRSKLMSNDVCSSVLVDGHLYGFDIRDQQTKLHRPSRGRVRCLDFLTGVERWADGPQPSAADADDTRPFAAKATGGPAPIGHASVIYADGKLIFFNDLGELILARASPSACTVLGRVQVLGGELCWTPPTLSQGRVFVRNHSRAACLILSLAGSELEGGPRLTVADIPRSTYYDWASLLLPVEREFAMDLPADQELWRSYLACLAGLLAASALAFTGHWALSRIESARRFYPVDNFNGRNVLRTGMMLVFGICGTTLLSGSTQHFVFTWPLVLFGLFHVVVRQAGSRSDLDRTNRLRARISLCVFLATCLGYFLLCRRLGLAFEWIFLAGFIGAAPILIWGRRASANTPAAYFRQTLQLAAAFSAYYLASVALLWVRY